MIEVGDLVRVKNSALRAGNNIFGSFTRTRWKGYKRFRGKQTIARVVRIEESYDWRSKRLHRLVTLDIPDPSPLFKDRPPRLWQLDAAWLVVHRKFKKDKRCRDRAA
jgi:hypothetical protein